VAALAVVIAAAIPPPALRLHAARSDLDDLMAQVLATRDENWKKLRQYVLDEREFIEILGPGRARIWGDQRDYTWFIQDGFFVRSPVKVNGATVSDADRRSYEADFLRRAKAREKPGDTPAGASGAGDEPRPEVSGDPAAAAKALLSQSRRPAFIDTAYFLRFKFEPGKYALVGRETLDGRPTLRVEYYPSRLFTHEQNAEKAREQTHASDSHEDMEATTERMMNKVALVTLWIDPDAHQIVRYTFDNVDLDFLPGAWFMRVDGLTASMTMGQPFPGVWLPDDVDMRMTGVFAAGDLTVHYHVDYHDYREATSSGRVIVGARP
jgi:hypothetical protein